MSDSMQILSTPERAVMLTIPIPLSSASEDVPAKSVADGESKSESAADAFTADVDVGEENNLQSSDLPAKSVADSQLNAESAAGAFTADVEEENDLRSSEDVPAKSVADSELNPLSGI